jgi:predicted deacylase
VTARTARATTKVTRRWLRERHAGGPDVELPIIEIGGAGTGGSVALIAGMHGGEYAGPLAMYRLVDKLEASEVSGRVLVIPIVSTRSFFERAIQLSPVDNAELHYVWPGHPEASHSAHVIDLVYRTVRGFDAVVDMHAGEFTQELTPYVAVPWERDDESFAECLRLASAYDVPFVDKRAVSETPLALPRALLAEGVPNIWTEIGRNGLPEPETIELQLDGALNILRLLGIVPGVGRTRPQRVVGPRHWGVVATESGVWEREVAAGDFVSAGRMIGRMRDALGHELRTYVAEADATVQFVCTSPAIDVDRRPGGSTWHQLLAQLVEDPHRASND